MAPSGEGQVTKNLVLTGTPGVGKTTLIKEVTLPYLDRVGGFYTEQILDGGKRSGFKIRTFDGREGVLASKGLASPARLNKYGIDLGTLERLGVGALVSALEGKRVVVVDEIGSMEILSERFRATVLQCLASPHCRVLATIRRGSQPFTDSIKKMYDTEVMELTRDGFLKARDAVQRWLVDAVSL